MKKRSAKNSKGAIVTKKVKVEPQVSTLGVLPSSKREVEPLLTFEQVSELTGLTVSYLRKAVYQLDIPSYKIGGRRFKLSEVDLWIKQRKQAG